jgi:hypothetical protein
VNNVTVNANGADPNKIADIVSRVISANLRDVTMR